MPGVRHADTRPAVGAIDRCIDRGVFFLEPLRRLARAVLVALVDHRAEELLQRGPGAIPMGKLTVFTHDGKGGVTWNDRPFVIDAVTGRVAPIPWPKANALPRRNAVVAVQGDSGTLT